MPKLKHPTDKYLPDSSLQRLKVVIAGEQRPTLSQRFWRWLTKHLIGG